MTDLSMTTSRTISAARDRVFNAWLDPQMLAKFMTPGPGMSVPKADANPEKGGRFNIVMKAGDDEIPHSGTYLEIDPHARLVFTWESPFSVPESTVTLEFDDVDGGTKVTLTHVKFASEEVRDNHQSGWTGILDALAAALAKA